LLIDLLKRDFAFRSDRATVGTGPKRLVS